MRLRRSVALWTVFLHQTGPRKNYRKHSGSLLSFLPLRIRPFQVLNYSRAVWWMVCFSLQLFRIEQVGLITSILTGTAIKFAPITVDVTRRKELLLDAFVGRRIKGLNVAQTPFTTLVKKLHESLTRMESFDVVTVAQSSDGAIQFQSPVPNISHSPHLDSKRSSPSLLARQLRLRLVAVDDSDIPRNLHNIVVSIHAIATFQALHDYLRPRVAGLLNSEIGRAHV